VQPFPAVSALTAFYFTGSMVGPYHKIVLAVITPPLVKEDMKMPKSAFYPFLVGTSTPESREHAIERWHLKHYMSDIHIDMTEKDGVIRSAVHENGKPILDFTIHEHQWAPVRDLYQSFMIDGDERFKANVYMEGDFTEHEEESGELNLHDHPMCEGLLDANVESYPFRELWMKRGLQTFEPLETI